MGARDVLENGCTCPHVMHEDPPCPMHGYPKCEQCGEDEHDYISCDAVANILKRTDAPRVDR